MRFDDTGLPCVAPSPNLPTPASALVYPGQVLWEGTNVSEGRGTTQNALPAILDLIEARGYRAVTVPQLLAMDPPTAEQLRSHACP